MVTIRHTDGHTIEHVTVEAVNAVDMLILLREEGRTAELLDELPALDWSDDTGAMDDAAAEAAYRDEYEG